MQIQVSGREYSGTCQQILIRMRDESFSMFDGNLRDYIAFMRRNLLHFFGIDLPMVDSTEAKMAEQFVRGMLARGLASPAPHRR